jgi:hypothetical protein
MNPAMRAEINRKNAQNSTGPTSEAGKQKSALNGIKHGLTGQRLLLQPHEVEPYQRMTAAFKFDYSPQTEIESQLVQHIVDCNMRLHRIAAIESNMFAVGTIDNIREDIGHDDATETVVAQTRAWIKQADSFEKLGRHEGRLSRQLLKYTQEIDRVQTNRRNNPVQLEETKPDNPELASSCKTSESPAPMAAAATKTPGTEGPDGLFLVKPPAAVLGQALSPECCAQTESGGQALSPECSAQTESGGQAQTFGTTPDAMII